MEISQNLLNKAVDDATKRYIKGQVEKIGHRGVHYLEESLAALKKVVKEAIKGLGVFQKLDAMHLLCDRGIENGGVITLEDVGDIMNLREEKAGKRATVENVVVDSTNEQQPFPVTRDAGRENSFPVTRDAERKKSSEIENGLA